MGHLAAVLVAAALAAEGAPVNTWNGGDPSGACAGSRVVVSSTTGRVYRCVAGQWRTASASVVNVLDGGARGDDSHDDTAAIQAALDSGAGSPVTVVLPPGRYRVAPAAAGDAYPGNDCLRIRYSNVTVAGAGSGVTTIKCYVTGMQDPNTHWEVTHPAGVATVWRGNGINLVGNLSNITLRGFRLTGNSPRNLTTYPVWGVATGQFFPASTVTGEGWDITNKGIMVGNGTTTDAVVIEDTEIDSFRGELIYYGGNGLGRLAIRRSFLHDSIGDAISVGGILTAQDNEISFTENAVENTPLDKEQVIERNYVHDNKIGIVFANNIAPASAGLGRVRILNNRIATCYRGAVWVRGGIQGLTAERNDISDSGMGTDAALFVANAYGYGPADISFIGNTIRAEAWSIATAIRVSQDAGYPVKNIRFVSNRTELSEYMRSVTGVVGHVENNLYDATSSVYYEDNDFAGGGTAFHIGTSSSGAASAGVPFFGVYRPNRFSKRDSAGDLAFLGDASTSSLTAIRPSAPVFQVQPASAGWNNVVSMSAAGIPDGQRAVIMVNGATTAGVHWAATGTGWRFRRPYWLTKWGNGPAFPGEYMMLTVRNVGGIWYEETAVDGHSPEGALSFYSDLDTTPLPSSPFTSNWLWLSGSTADTFAPTIPLYWTTRVTLAPASPATYTTFSDAPNDVPIIVDVNANVTISTSSTVKLAGGVSFAPGGTGGVITFVRPNGKSAIYEVSRSTY